MLGKIVAKEDGWMVSAAHVSTRMKELKQRKNALYENMINILMLFRTQSVIVY
jgi:hypothetical protein